MKNVFEELGRRMQRQHFMKVICAQAHKFAIKHYSRDCVQI